MRRRRRTSLVARALSGGSAPPTRDLAALERDLRRRSHGRPAAPEPDPSRSFATRGMVLPDAQGSRTDPVSRNAGRDPARARAWGPEDGPLPFEVAPFTVVDTAAPSSDDESRPPATTPPIGTRRDPRPVAPPQGRRRRAVPDLTDEDIDADLELTRRPDPSASEAAYPGSRQGDDEALAFLSEARELAPKPAAGPTLASDRRRPTEDASDAEREGDATEHPHAIFERMGHSMAASTSYELGELTLAKRFDAWDAEMAAAENEPVGSSAVPADDLSEDELAADLADIAAPPTPSAADARRSSRAEAGTAGPTAEVRPAPEPPSPRPNADGDRAPDADDLTDTDDEQVPTGPDDVAGADTSEAPATPILLEEQTHG